jgi:hypothetical protein
MLLKSQAAMEYYTIISVALIILLPLSVYVYQLLNEYGEDTNLSLAKDTVNKLGENVDWVFSQGPPAKLSLEFYIPEGIQQTSLDNKMILFKMRTSAGITDVYYQTICNLTGSIPIKSGHYQFSIVANTTYVNISVV